MYFLSIFPLWYRRYGNRPWIAAPPHSRPLTLFLPPHYQKSKRADGKKKRKSPECGFEAEHNRDCCEQCGGSQKIGDQHPAKSCQFRFHYGFLSKSVHTLLSLTVASKKFYRRKSTFFVRFYPTLALALQSAVLFERHEDLLLIVSQSGEDFNRNSQFQGFNDAGHAYLKVQYVGINTISGLTSLASLAFHCVPPIEQQGGP